jgi:hypothetical protein
MSQFFGLPVFQIPTALFGRRNVHTIEIPVDPVIYVPNMVTINHRYVGCIFITNSASGYGYDIILPRMSGQNIYSVYSGKVGGLYNDYDCMCTLLSILNLNIDYSTPSIEVRDPSSGIPYKVYVKYLHRLDLPRINNSLNRSIASNDYAYFTRFPTNMISLHQSCQSIKDDAGVDKYLDAISSSIVSKINANIGRYV